MSSTHSSEHSQHFVDHVDDDQTGEMIDAMEDLNMDPRQEGGEEQRHNDHGDDHGDYADHQPREQQLQEQHYDGEGKEEKKTSQVTIITPSSLSTLVVADDQMYHDLNVLITGPKGLLKLTLLLKKMKQPRVFIPFGHLLKSKFGDQHGSYPGTVLISGFGTAYLTPGQDRFEPFMQAGIKDRNCFRRLANDLAKNGGLHIKIVKKKMYDRESGEFVEHHRDKVIQLSLWRQDLGKDGKSGKPHVKR